MKIRALFANVCISFFSFLLILIALELFVFRFVLLPSEPPENVYMGGLVRLAPGQTGTIRYRGEYAVRYSINHQGWNSGIGDYIVARRAGIPRLVIIGDSYVEALSVDRNHSLAERVGLILEAAVEKPVEVYRVGISGAPF